MTHRGPLVSRGPLACDYAVDGSVSKSHCSDGKLRVIHQSLPQLVAGAVLTAPVVTIRMTTLDYPSEEDLKVELENLPVHANGGSEESSGNHASLVADITAAVLAALDAKAKDAAGRAAQTWRGQWDGKYGTWKRSPLGEWKLEDSAANEGGAATSTPIANAAAATAQADPPRERWPVAVRP